MKCGTDKINLSAEQILAIGGHAPEKLFSGNLETAKDEYHALSRCWHPDRNPDSLATAVFQRITELYRTTQECLKTGTWRGAGILELPVAGSGGRSGVVSRPLNYLKKTAFELGEMYLGQTEIAFAVERQYADLFENAKQQISAFRYANSKMEQEMSKYLPRNPEYFMTAENLIMVLPKPANAVLLEDLLDYLGGSIEATHIAWIGNRLYNLACYFEYAGIVHHDIASQTFFVSPEFHSGMLLGGWWYARPKGAKINALPKRTINYAPPDVFRLKKADGRVDLELIRQTGLELSGAKAGRPPAAGAAIPPAMARWFKGATSGSAVTDYKLWGNVLGMDFGAPRFIPLDVKPEAVYKY